MKLSVTLTSRDSNSGSANFIDDVRSFKISHALGSETDQHGKVGELKFSFFLGEKLSKLEHTISSLKEIDILEIVDEITDKYHDMDKSENGVECHMFILSDDKKCHIQFDDLVIDRDIVKIDSDIPNIDYSKNNISPSVDMVTCYANPIIASLTPYYKQDEEITEGYVLISNRASGSVKSKNITEWYVRKIGKSVNKEYLDKILVEDPYNPYANWVSQLADAEKARTGHNEFLIPASWLKYEDPLTNSCISYDFRGYNILAKVDTPIKPNMLRITADRDKNGVVREETLTIFKCGDSTIDLLRKHHTPFSVNFLTELYLVNIVPKEFYQKLLNVFVKHQLYWYDISTDYFLDNCLKGIEAFFWKHDGKSNYGKGYSNEVTK